MPASDEFVALLTKNQRKLHAYIFSLVWNPTDADDILQETNLALLKKSAEFDTARDFLPWALTFARFQALAGLKRLKRLRFVFDESLAMFLADEAAREDPVAEARRQALATCLQKLPPSHVDLLIRRYQPKAVVGDMAAALGLRLKTFSDRLRRIRGKLLDCIAKTLTQESLS
ncbi:MAG: sigma-70 family RNA polymerase sigma factor [Pirellulales bacterium]